MLDPTIDAVCNEEMGRKQEEKLRRWYLIADRGIEFPESISTLWDYILDQIQEPGRAPTMCHIN